jgi:hypothetical protein
LNECRKDPEGKDQEEKEGYKVLGSMANLNVFLFLIWLRIAKISSLGSSNSA